MIARAILMLTAAVSMMALANGAQAAPLVYDFTPPPSGNLGSSEPYTQGAITITAFSGTTNGTSTVALGSNVLFGKNSGADEQGLGVCQAGNNNCNDSNEINRQDGVNELVQLDIQNLLAAGYNSFKLNADSADSSNGGEHLLAYKSNSSASLGTLIASMQSSQNDVSVGDLAGFRYLNFTIDCSANNCTKDALVHSLTADKVAVPEPASLALLGSGLIGMAWAHRRRRNRA